jgi:hypothetical protein
MEGLAPYLVAGLLITFVGSTLVLLAAFALWIYSLRSELRVYAPLVDKQRRKDSTRLPRPGQRIISPRPSQSYT